MHVAFCHRKAAGNRISARVEAVLNVNNGRFPGLPLKRILHNK